MKKSRRLLLATAALSSAAVIEACSKEPLPGPPANPKGSHYDNAEAGPATTPTTTPSSSATPSATVLPLPANPKGSHYDEGMDAGKPAPPTTASAKPKTK